ncbi:hypothetical protein [uncultured Endozoicomonas sp.]|uniref:hypothetical protein n=1 Tax=uncultured Endozoicomonas sp. TaxID=432652 RepID=UPI002628AC87|nr:hypothetical protein [uncultured Endozoicomonas sp.]
MLRNIEIKADLNASQFLKAGIFLVGLFYFLQASFWLPTTIAAYYSVPRHMDSSLEFIDLVSTLSQLVISILIMAGTNYLTSSVQKFRAFGNTTSENA